MIAAWIQALPKEGIVKAVGEFHDAYTLESGAAAFREALLSLAPPDDSSERTALIGLAAYIIGRLPKSDAAATEWVTRWRALVEGASAERAAPPKDRTHEVQCPYGVAILNRRTVAPGTVCTCGPKEGT